MININYLRLIRLFHLLIQSKCKDSSFSDHKTITFINPHYFHKNPSIAEHKPHQSDHSSIISAHLSLASSSASSFSAIPTPSPLSSASCRKSSFSIENPRFFHHFFKIGKFSILPAVSIVPAALSRTPPPPAAARPRQFQCKTHEKRMKNA